MTLLLQAVTLLLCIEKLLNVLGAGSNVIYGIASACGHIATVSKKFLEVAIALLNRNDASIERNRVSRFSANISTIVVKKPGFCDRHSFIRIGKLFVASGLLENESWCYSNSPGTWCVTLALTAPYGNDLVCHYRESLKSNDAI
jgi:hypothetical protein